MGANQSSAMRHLIVTVESAPGTYVAPATADHVIRIRNVEFTPDIPVDDDGSKYANGHHAEDQSIATTQSGTLSFEAKIITSGAAATEPQWFTLAKMCGCDVLTFATNKGKGLVRRKAKDDTTYSCAVYDTEIGVGSGTAVTTIYKMAGCVGNMTVSAAINGVWTAKFSVKGKLNDIVDGTDIALNAGIGSQLAQPFAGDAVSIHTTASAVSQWEFDLGNEMQPVYLSSDATGISHYVLTGAKPRFKCNPLAVKQATTDWLAKHLTHTSSASTYITVGTAAATKYTLKVIDAQPVTPALGSREGLVSWDLTFRGLANGVPGTLLDSTTGLTQEDTFLLLHGQTT